MTHIFQKNMNFLVLLRINCSLKQRKEDVLKHLSKVWNYLLGSENVTE